MALAGTLIIDIAANTARLQQDMAQAKGIVAGAAKDIERSVGLAKAALGALGVAMSVGAVTGYVRDIVKATAALDDMAEITGTTVEQLSRLSQVAKIGGHDMGLVEDSLVKLTKGLKGADEETKGAAAALQYLGITAKDASGRLRDPGELMQEIAKRLGAFEDGAGKTALALDLFGKSGAKLLPFLKDMVELGGGVAKVTAEQAAQAEQLEKDWRRLASAGEAWKKELALGALPVLVELTQKMVDAQKAAGNLAAALLQVTMTDTANPRQRIGEIDAQLREMDTVGGAPGWLPGSGLVNGALEVKRSFLQRQRAFLLLQEQRAGAAAGDNAGNWDARDRRLRDRAVATYTGAGKPAAAGGASGPDDGANLILGLRDQLQAASGEASVFDTVMRKLTDGTKKYSDETVATALALAGEIDQMKKARAEQERLQKLNEERLGQQFRAIEQADDEIRRLEEQNAEIGLNAQQLAALKVARLDDAIAIRERQAANAAAYETDAAYVETLRLQAEQLRRVRDLTREGAARTAAAEEVKKAEEASKRLQENLERGLTEATIDGLATGFRRGESVAQNFLRTLEGMFKSAILTPIIQPLVRPVANAVSNTIGGMMGGSSGGMPSIPGLDLGSLFGGGGGGVLGTGATAGAFGEAASLTAMTEAAALGGSAAGTVGAGFSVAGALPWLGVGALALGLLGGDLFGDGGGPKPSDVGLISDGMGGLAYTQNNVTDTGAGEAWGGIFRSRYAALSPEARALVTAGSWSAGGPATSQSLIQQYIEPMLARAEQFDRQKAQKEEADRAAQKQLLERMVSEQEQANANLASFAASTTSRLGIDTLRSAIGGLATSGYVAPRARFAAARSQLDQAYAAAIGGDLGAVQSFPSVLQNTLGIGRDVYASGPQFAEVFSAGNRMLNELLSRQTAVQNELLRGVPAAVIQSGRDTVDELRALQSALVDKLGNLETEIVRLRQAVA